MRGVKACAAAVLAAAWTLGATAVAQVSHPWPTKEFEIRTDIPLSLNRHAEQLRAVIHGNEDRIENVEPTLRQMVLMENHLKKVATYLEGLGFLPPVLKIEESERRPGTDVYVVHAYNFPGAAGGVYHGNALGIEITDYLFGSYIRIDTWGNPGTPTLAGTTGVTNYGYRTLSHELFHAVQGAYPLFKDSLTLTGDWIIEGTAEAFEALVEEEVRGRNLRGTARAGPGDERNYETKFKPRDYSKALWVGAGSEGPASRRGYGTASFWLYLAELAGASTTQVPSLDEGPRDFSYIQDFFNIEVDGFHGHHQELLWLKKAVRERFNRSIPGIFSEFVTLQAGYVPVRGGPSDGAKDWLKRLYGFCPSVRLSPSNPSAGPVFEFAPVSARCIELSVEGREPVELLIVGRNLGTHIDDAESLTGIFVGVPGGHIVDRPDVAIPARLHTESESDALLGIWRVPFDPLIDQALIISSIANIKVENPLNGPVDFTIIRPGWGSSVTATPAAPAPASGASTGAASETASQTGTASRTLNAERETAAARANRALKTFSTSVRAATNLTRRTDYAACEEPFKFQVCGPHMAMTLELSPGSLFDLGATSGRGGIFAQFAGNLLAADAAAGGAAGAGNIQAWIEQQQSLPGHKITLSFPLIDYGFSGTFNNAKIDVWMPDNVIWETVGPADAMEGRGKMFAFSGRVSIDEYTPEVLRGSFGGALVDTRDAVDAGDNPILPIKHQLSGRFSLAAPVMDDERTQFLSPLDLGTFFDDFEILMPGMSGAAEDPVARARAEAERNPARSYTPEASRPELCDCSCNYAELASPVCQNVCGYTFSACDGEAFAPEALRQPRSPAAEKSALDQSRDRFYEFLESTKGKRHAELWIQIYDGLPEDYDERRLWLRISGYAAYFDWEEKHYGGPPINN